MATKNKEVFESDSEEAKKIIKKKKPVKKKKMSVTVRNVSVGKKADKIEPIVIKEEAEPEIELKLAELKKEKEKKLQLKKEIKNESPVFESNRQPKPVRKPGFYGRLALTFIVLTVFLLAVISYFAFSKVVITLIPKTEKINNSALFVVYDNDSSRNINENTAGESGKGLQNNELIGVVKVLEVKKEKTYESSGAEKIGEEVVGQVTLINKYTKNQPLVATTRLMSSDGKLFRLRNTVNIPAGGSVEAEVYADKPSAEMAITPGKFSIPGLWAGLQDKIYAESKIKFVYQEQTKKRITQADIDHATEDIKRILVNDIQNQYGNGYENFSQVLTKIDDKNLVVETNVEVGEEKESFVVRAKGNVALVAFNPDKAEKLANNELSVMIPDGKELLDFDKKAIAYELTDYDLTKGQAQITANFEGRMCLKKNSNIIDREKITGLNAEQLSSYLKNFKELSGYEISFSPSFVRRVPDLVDRIEVNIR
jgi:hypothetical protein